MPRIAAEIDAVTSPSWISLIRAPAARISSIRSWWRGRSSTIVVMSLTFRPNASAIARDVVLDRRVEVDRARRARADGHPAHVHVRQARGASPARRPRSSTSRRSRRARRRRAPRAGRARGRTTRRRRRPRCRPRADALGRRSRSSRRSAARRARRASRPRRTPRRVLVVAAEPARAAERGPLGRTRERLAEARRPVLFDARLAHRAHLSAARSARSSTSSITDPTASTRRLVLDHGTSHRRARSTM